MLKLFFKNIKIFFMLTKIYTKNLVLEHYAPKHFFVNSRGRFLKMDIFKNVQNQKIAMKIFLKNLQHEKNFEYFIF